MKPISSVKSISLMLLIMMQIIFTKVNAQCPASITAFIQSQVNATCPSNATLVIGSNANGVAGVQYQFTSAPAGISLAATVFIGRIITRR